MTLAETFEYAKKVGELKAYAEKLFPVGGTITILEGSQSTQCPYCKEIFHETTLTLRRLE